MGWNFNVFKEPRGFIKLIQFVSIITLTDYKSASRPMNMSSEYCLFDFNFF